MTTRIASFFLCSLLLASAHLHGQGGPPGGEIINLHVIRTQPDVVFAATVGGIFRSVDGGHSWSDRSAGLPAVDANDVDGPSWRLYAGLGAGEGVWLSLNGGVWQATTNVFGGNDVFGVAVHPENPMLVLASTVAGVFRSTNGGVSWDEPGGGRPATAIADIGFSPSDPNRVVAVGQTFVYDSVDSGESWSTDGSNAIIRRVTFDPSTVGRYFLATDSGIIRRDTPGGAFTFLSQPGLVAITSLTVDPKNSDRIYAFTDNFGLIRSEDGGDSWLGGEDGLPRGIVFSSAPVTSEPGRFIAGFNGTGIYATEDQGVTWKLSSDGMNASSIRAMAVSPTDNQTLWAGLSSAGLFRSTDGGGSWIESREGYFNRDPFTIEVDPQDGSRVYVGSVDPVSITSGGLARSVDGGETWVQTAGSRDYRTIGIDPINSQNVIAGGTANFFTGREGFIRSPDGGDTFLLVSQLFSQFNVVDLSYSQSTPTTVWAIANTSGVWSLWVSGDGGFLFAGPVFESGTPYNQIEIDPTEDDRIYFTTDGAGVLRTVPGATGFEGANVGLANGGAVSVLSLAISPDSPANLLIATNFGVYRSSNFGASWALSETGLPPRGVRKVTMAIGGIAYAATRSTGLYVSEDNGITWSPAGRHSLTEAGIVHGASFRGGALASGQIGSIFGGPFTDVLELATAIPLPTSLSGVTVTVTDGVGGQRDAALFFASTGQINFEVPAASASGSGMLTVHFKDGSEATVPIEITAVSPGLFASAGTGEGPASAGAVRIDGGGLQSPVAVTTFSDGQHRTVPISVADGEDPVVLLLFGSGLRGFSTVQAFVDGQEVTVFGVADQLQFVGLDQANIDLPSSLAGSGVVEVYLVIDGVRTNSVLIEIA